MKKCVLIIAAFFVACVAPVVVIAQPVVDGNVISWPDDGWYQVQSADDFNSICEGQTFCEVAVGQYIVINHTTGERFPDIVVESTSSDTSGITVQDHTISWPADGWYQVQSALDYSEQCAGTLNCTVEPGAYIVINHSTGVRQNVLVVGNEQQGPLDDPTTDNSINSESNLGQLQARVQTLASNALLELNRSLNQGEMFHPQENQCMGAFDPALGEPLLTIDCEQPLSVDNVPIYLKSAVLENTTTCKSRLQNNNVDDCSVVQADLTVNTLWYVAPANPGQPQRPQPKAGTRIQYNTEQNLLSFENLPAALSGYFNCEYDLNTGNTDGSNGSTNCDQQAGRIVELIDAQVATQHL